MTSHIFGATDSPSCANFCLKRAADYHKGRFSDEAVSAVGKYFYADDFVKSVRTVTEASSLAGEVTCLLSEAGFRLTKWMSNIREVLSKIPDADRANPTLDLVCSENDNASEDSHASLSRLIESCSSLLTLQRRVAWIIRL